jgi:hypothetical protein
MHTHCRLYGAISASCNVEIREKYEKKNSNNLFQRYETGPNQTLKLWFGKQQQQQEQQQQQPTNQTNKNSNNKLPHSQRKYAFVLTSKRRVKNNPTQSLLSETEGKIVSQSTYPVVWCAEIDFGESRRCNSHCWRPAVDWTPGRQWPNMTAKPHSPIRERNTNTEIDKSPIEILLYSNAFPKEILLYSNGHIVFCICFF